MFCKTRVAYTFLIYLLELVKKLFGEMTLGPANSVGIVGKHVILQCSVNSLTDTVDWFYRSSAKKSVHLTRNSDKIHLRFRQKVKVLYDDSDRNYIAYYLNVFNLTMEDAGHYSCFVISGFQQRQRLGVTVDLSIFFFDSCLSYLNYNHLQHFCNFQIAGITRYYFTWYCRQASNNTLSVKKHKGVNLNGTPIQMYFLVLSTTVNYTNMAELETCSLGVTVRRLVPVDIEDVDDTLPEFKFGLYFISTMVAVTHKHLTKKSCIRDKNGFMPLEAVQQLSDTYETLHKLPIQKPENIGNMKNYSCVINSVPLQRVIPTTRSAFDIYNSVSCQSKGVFQCYDNFTNHIDSKTFFIDLGFEEYKMLCENLKVVESCVEAYKPCKESPEMRGTMDSYRFLCSTDYTSYYQIPVNTLDFKLCDEHYPQSMANIYNRAGTFYKLTPNGEANEFLLSMFCERLDVSSLLFCVEHILASSASIELGRWYLKFVSHLKQYRIYEFFPHYAKHFNQSKFFKGCSDFTYREISRAECTQISKCFPPLTLLLEVVNAGFVVIQDVTLFKKNVCKVRDKVLNACMEKVLPRCNITIFNLYRSLVPIKKALCTDLKRAYFKHHNCYIRIQEGVFVTPKCSWKSIYNSLFSHTGSMQEFTEEVCRMGKLHFQCIGKLVSQRCGPEAAYLQKHFVKLLLTHTFDQLFCVNSFKLGLSNSRVDFLINRAGNLLARNSLAFFVSLSYLFCLR